MSSGEIVEDALCRICYQGREDGPLFSPCKCSGSMKYVHVKCLEKWREFSPNPKSIVQCDYCKYEYHLYRPKLSHCIQNEYFISGVTLFTVSAMTLGSGSAVALLSKSIMNSNERLELKNVTLYGLAVIGLFGLADKLPLLFREVFQNQWYKMFQGDFVIPVTFGLLSIGVLSAFTGVYQKVHQTSRNIAKLLGERVLDVQ